MVLRFELRASCLLGKQSTTWATLLTHQHFLTHQISLVLLFSSSSDFPTEVHKNLKAKIFFSFVIHRNISKDKDRRAICTNETPVTQCNCHVDTPSLICNMITLISPRTTPSHTWGCDLLSHTFSAQLCALFPVL
jgi:hypothetical protein